MIRLICIDVEALTGSIEFWSLLHQVYGTSGALPDAARQWIGKDAQPYYDLAHQVECLPGAAELFAALDQHKEGGSYYETTRSPVARALITDGPYELAARIKEAFGADFLFANQLDVKDGKISGMLQWPVGRYTRAQIVEQLCDDLEILPQQVLYIGATGACADALKIVGVSIAVGPAADELHELATHMIESESLLNLIPVVEEALHRAD